MALKFYNTLSRKLETYQSIRPGVTDLYTCGPTVYNYAHIGNFRAYMFEDILRRTLAYCGYTVRQVMNLTDVDDKTIRDSRAADMDLATYTRTFTKAFFEDLDTLNIEKAEHYPAATDHVPEMIAMIDTLLDKGYAYVGDDKSVYFSIERYPDYGKLARIDLSQQRSGVRIKADEYGKESVADFALWKHWDDDDGDVYWDSPWGRGRPGWHIECSAMSVKYLGNHFDIHTGGVDNLFPHHEDEIAQCEAATGEKFVNYWLHCAHLLVNNEKMSKSAGNFYTLRDLIKKGFDGREIRWLLMSAHYRQHLNFTLEGLSAARSVLRRIDDFVVRLKELSAEGDAGLDLATDVVEVSRLAFRKGLEDDLNMSAAIAAYFDFMHRVNKAVDEAGLGGNAIDLLLNFCREVDRVFGVIHLGSAEPSVPAAIQALADERLAARRLRDFDRADSLRDDIHAAGWRIDDTPKGTRLVRVSRS